MTETSDAVIRFVDQRDGMRKCVNVLLCVTAVVGIGLSATVLWRNLNARHQINEACAGLVPAGRVLALSPAGGTISHRLADEGTIELDGGLPQDCEIFSTEAGQKHHTSSGERWFFTATVGVLPTGAEDQWMPEDPLDHLADPYSDDPTYPAEPMGGGISGAVTATSVTVRLSCTDGTSGGDPIKELWARAALMDPGPAFLEKGQLTSHDRNILAETAVGTANNLAERLDCTNRLADPPENVPALEEGPVPAGSADGTCAWYHKADFASDRQLPDQVLESRTDDKAWDERCGLTLSGTRANALWESDASKIDSFERPSQPAEWYVSLHTYAGEPAKNVYLKSDYENVPTAAVPGQAGRSDRPIWWASSVCDGKPQIHTMTVSYPYNRLTIPALEKVFRAYVTDVVARRGCTDTELPAASTFYAD
ncbi:hypothetical protein [Streptomyces sp. NPDC102476]|uniref:hypothetical protein n=1 Tax=Streptomyces sp. NPDC102476 TaxID=3366181 RepID=UPI0037F98F26